MPLRRVSEPIKTVGCILAGLPVVLAILAPLFAASRPKAHVATCISNVKQLNIGFLMYVQDYDETLPPAAHWASATLPYVKNEGILHCPAAASPYSYAFNRSLGGCATNKLEDVAHTVLLFESEAAIRDANGGKGSVTGQNRHNGLVYGFLDGHARMMQFERRDDGSLHWQPKFLPHAKKP